MTKRTGVKRSVIEISSSSEEEKEGSSEESEQSDDGYDVTRIEDISSSVSSDSEGDYVDEDEALDDDDDDDDNDDDIHKEGEDSGCDSVLRLLQGGGDLRKLKGELMKLRLIDYKAYLQLNKLRLSGTKEECIERIIEHWRMRGGNGQRLYPRSSFTINCTGDVCKGDVVLFKQKVYKNFDKMTRGGSGQVLGKRTIAGRIVKESYGAAKQQHTFTVEVLWSQGVKPLPPLFPLLVKGRNLYKMRTFRQRWKNENVRLKVLAEKHRRGEAARSIRASRKSKPITNPAKTSSRNRGNKRQKIDSQWRPNEMMQTGNVKKRNISNDEREKEMMQTGNVKKRNISNDEREKAMVGSKRTKNHHQMRRPPGRSNLTEFRNSRAPLRHPNFVPSARETSSQFDHPSVNNFHHSESNFYSQRVPYSYSSNWGSAPRPYASSYTSYALPAPEQHQQYAHGSYPNFPYPRYVSQSSNSQHFHGMAGTHRSSGPFPIVNCERRWNF